MIRVIDIFEYSSVPDGVTLYGDSEQWREGLDAFLREVWDARPKSESWDQSDENVTPTQQGYLRIENKCYKASFFVGTICFEGTTINIWPKVFAQGFTQAKDEAAKVHFRTVMTLDMLHWASRADYLRLSLSSGDSALPPEGVSTFFDAYIWLFASFTRDLLARQPYWQYQAEVEEGQVLRGRLVMDKYVNDCLARGRWHRLVYEHEPFDFDNLLNRIIKRTCKIAYGLCLSSAVREKIADILFELDEVEDSFCTVRDCDRVHLNRMHVEYQIVLDNCRAILSQSQPDDSGQDMKRFCFLLPMDRLYEEYLRALANESALGGGDLRLEAKKKAVFARGDNPPNTKLIRFENDFFFTGKKGVIVADAKWKDRKKNEAKGNFGINRADIYQMVAYAHRLACREVHLFYPAPDNSSAFEKITKIITETNDETSITIHVWELKVHTSLQLNSPLQKNWLEMEKGIITGFMKNILCL